jgi:hypothetical protein
MRPLPTETLQRITKLLLLMSSSHDGERASAAAAIGRTLENAGADWHDLVGLLGAYSGAGASPTPEGKTPAPASSWKRTTGPTDLPRDQLIQLLDLVEERTPFLPIKSAGFVSSLRERSYHRPTIHLSDKQWRWLQDLIEATGV